MKNTGEEIPDSITGVKFGSLAWTGDNSGIFYSVRFFVWFIDGKNYSAILNIKVQQKALRWRNMNFILCITTS